jgi:hypothetical protein
MVPVSSISSIITTTAGSARVGWNTDSPVCTAVPDRSPIRCRAHCRAPGDALPQAGVLGLQAGRGHGGQRRPGQLVAAARRVQLDQDRVVHRGDPLAQLVQEIGLAASGHAVDADRLAALLVPQDQVHRLAGLGDDPDRDRVADAGRLGEPVRVGGLGVQRRMGDRAGHRRVLLADLDDQLAGVVGGADADPAVGQAAQVRVPLRVGPAAGRHAGGQLAARRAGQQQLLAQAGGCHRLQVKVARANPVRDPVPFGLTRGPRGGVVAALAAARTAGWLRSHR